MSWCTQVLSGTIRNVFSNIQQCIAFIRPEILLFYDTIKTCELQILIITMNVFSTLQHIFVVFLLCLISSVLFSWQVLSNKYSNIFLEGFYVVSPKIDGKSLEKFRFFIEVCIGNTYFNCWAAFLQRVSIFNFFRISSVGILSVAILRLYQNDFNRKCQVN